MTNVMGMEQKNMISKIVIYNYEAHANKKTKGPTWFMITQNNIMDSKYDQFTTVEMNVCSELVKTND